MKYVVILCDGMADYAVKELSGKTPLESAHTPNFDYMAKYGEVGTVRTVPEGMTPGSDTANLSVMGYDPKVYYTGRSPFEAISAGIDISGSDMVFRCNFVTLSDDEPYEKKLMLDHSSDEITSEESRELIDEMNRYFKTDDIKFYPGISYRNIMVWKNGPADFKLTPPHDIIGKNIDEYIKGNGSNKIIFDMMRKSSEILTKHPVNIRRRDRGLNMGNSMWIWGEGKKPSLVSFRDKYGLDGAVISAVDLIKGIGICCSLDSIDVEGATGNVNTNYCGKAEAALSALKNGKDFVYIHIEAPDECGHRHEIENKVKAIEQIDQKIAGVILDRIGEIDKDYRIMVLPDHPTPLELRTHTNEPVPFLIYDSTKKVSEGNNKYTEKAAAMTQLKINEGYRLMDYFLGKTAGKDWR